MVERSLSMREVRGSIPRISIFFCFIGFAVFSLFILSWSPLLLQDDDPGQIINPKSFFFLQKYNRKMKTRYLNKIEIF